MSDTMDPLDYYMKVQRNTNLVMLSVLFLFIILIGFLFFSLYLTNKAKAAACQEEGMRLSGDYTKCYKGNAFYRVEPINAWGTQYRVNKEASSE